MFPKGAERTLVGVEAVIDKDLASELLAREVEADLFVMATDVDGVYATGERRISGAWTRSRSTSSGRRVRRRIDGSQGRGGDPFVERTGKRAAIGGLADIETIVDGSGGTQVVPG